MAAPQCRRPPTSSISSFYFTFFALLVTSTIFTLVQALAPLEPEAGRIIFSVWLDTSNTTDGLDRPLLFNQRLGYNASAFQLGQKVPVGLNPNNEAAFANLTFLDETSTDAILFLTAYPDGGPLNCFNKVDSAAITELANFCAKVIGSGRRMMVRYAPEFNGDWMGYGNCPSEFISSWRNVTDAIRKVAPGVPLVWAPNEGAGYPFSINVPALSPTNMKLLDTNNDGAITEKDDPYLPYWPGDEYVDWVGISSYWFGSNYPYVRNDIAAENAFETYLGAPYDFYKRFAEAKNKPYVVTEAGAAYHIGKPGIDELTLKRSFWREYLTDANLTTRYPLLKMINQFEFKKHEEQTLRDFRITTNPTILSAFKSDLAAVSDRYIWSNYTSAINPVSTATVSAGTPGLGGTANGGSTGGSGNGGNANASKSSALHSTRTFGSWLLVLILGFLAFMYINL
ncbi:hypothetical protein HDU76_012809 [Blyttiomyces sp. JEL0837]|nr:hypothetical protein HDU76_012809 [Blyttiomyces sp. JEL0837]